MPDQSLAALGMLLMDRIEKLRKARDSVQVVFSEYLKIRGKGNPILVFEGKTCPSYYINKVQAVIGQRAVSQLIARSKKNVLGLRELIKRNATTSHDVVLYFVDKDFDLEPKSDTFDDLYVTRGYSIENELFDCNGLINFLRANFDIADADDERALDDIAQLFDRLSSEYLRESKALNLAVFLCRRNKVRCIPGDDATSFVTIDFFTGSAILNFESREVMFEKLGIDPGDFQVVSRLMDEPSDFESLDPLLEWRGKYHFSVLKKFTVFLANQRTRGLHPFKRAARVVVDPVHSGFLPGFAAFVVAPECLQRFVSKKLASVGH